MNIYNFNIKLINLLRCVCRINGIVFCIGNGKVDNVWENIQSSNNLYNKLYTISDKFI